MAAATTEQVPSTPSRSFEGNGDGDEDVFSAEPDPASHSYQHRFSSHFDILPLDLTTTSSPSQLKRTIEAHLQETDRRLHDTQQLGESLLRQRDDLSSRLEEVEQFQDEAQIPNDLRKRLADIEREHADVGREVARALIGPKSKQEDSQLSDSGIFTSQATGSPTKVSAPSRRHRNQPSTRAGDLQFAADISTSLLAQVRQLQSAVAERDATIKRVQAEREAFEHDVRAYSQKIRALDESEQRFKDENWNLETQRHELLTAAKDAQDKEKRLNASLGAALTEKTKLQNDLDEIRLVHSKLSEEHTAARKAHDTEIHGLKRNADAIDTERQSMQEKIDELISQNQELAKAMSGRSRMGQVSPGEGFAPSVEADGDRLDTPDDSPPPSPTKATPRHPGLESETLRSSLQHAQRMIQNLKGNIHREKTEKIELRRMLQEARDELEHRRVGENGSAAKRPKTRPDAFKKPARPDMLGGSRRPCTDVELSEDDWEDQAMESPSMSRSVGWAQASRDAARLTDLSDAYQTANDTEGTFDTADERNTTESEAFMTGAESLAGESTDELTETEDTASKATRSVSGRVPRASLATDRASHLSPTHDRGDEMQTPMQSSFAKFKLRNSRSSYNKQPVFADQSTPDSNSREDSISQDSPATFASVQSPGVGEQSLFAELGGMDEINSETHSTPARSSTMSSTQSTPGLLSTPSKSAVVFPSPVHRPAMVDSATMTEAYLNNIASSTSRDTEKTLLPSAFPLPLSLPASPAKRMDNSTQYTPQRSTADSPVQPGSSYITPPKTVWDENHHEPTTPARRSSNTANDSHFSSQLGYSGVLAQGSTPVHGDSHARSLAASETQLSAVTSQLATTQSELAMFKTNNEQLSAELNTKQNELETLRTKHAELSAMHSDKGRDFMLLSTNFAQLGTDLSSKKQELDALRTDHDGVRTELASKQRDLDTLRASHEQLSTNLESKQQELESLRLDHKTTQAGMESKTRDMRNLQNAHQQLNTVLDSKQNELQNLQASWEQMKAALDHKTKQLQDIENTHQHTRSELHDIQKELQALQTDHQQVLATLRSRENDLRGLQTTHGDVKTALTTRQREFEDLKTSHDLLKSEFESRERALGDDKLAHTQELDKLHNQIAGHTREMQDAQRARADESDRLNAVIATHLATITAAEKSHAQETNRLASELSQHRLELENLHKAHGQEVDRLNGLIAGHLATVDAARKTHSEDIDQLNNNITMQRSDMEKAQKANVEELSRLQSEISVHRQELQDAQNNHAQELDRLNNELVAGGIALRDAQGRHAQELDRLRFEIAGYRTRNQNAADAHAREVEQLHNNIAVQQSELERLNNALRISEERLTALSPSGFSGILSQSSEPIAPILRAPNQVERGDSPERPRTAEKIAGGSMLLSAAATVPHDAGWYNPASPIGASETKWAVDTERERIDASTRPQHEMSDNTRGRRNMSGDDVFGAELVRPTISQDQGSQTLLTANQLDQALKAKKSPIAPVTIPVRNRSPGTRIPTSPTRHPGRPSSRTREVSPIIEDSNPAMPSSSPVRPSSISSNRTSSLVSQQHPPLPPNHQHAIAKANNQVGSPTRRDASTLKAGGIMGPPTMPASAMRRPTTPNESARITSRQTNRGKRGTHSSQASRRSSVSSFASELDQRFNIRADQQAASHGFDAGPGSDPRMIQAITQTMIGEFLWKYTRKAGSKEMSTTRHRRYFWVHPYTKTLYWSDQDPQTAGRNELKAKSVAIESVRVVSDDNPMPPGLHRKSLEVTTPGRKVKFTASTGQRHETWFNALSYLLHRGEDANGTGNYTTGGGDITGEDIAEFSVNGIGARLLPNDSRMSMSSYNSRTTNNTSRRIPIGTTGTARQSLPTGTTLGSSSSQVPQAQIAESSTSPGKNNTMRRGRLDAPTDKDRTIRANSISRISRMFGSVTNRTKIDQTAQPQDPADIAENNSIYDASVVSDGRRAEEDEARRRQHERDNPGLEDVRACCDGKHNVGTLGHRHVPASSHNRLTNAINRSMSRRT